MQILGFAYAGVFFTKSDYSYIVFKHTHYLCFAKLLLNPANSDLGTIN